MKRLLHLLTGNFQYFEIDMRHPIKIGKQLEGLPEPSYKKVEMHKKELYLSKQNSVSCMNN